MNGDDDPEQMRNTRGQRRSRVLQDFSCRRAPVDFESKGAERPIPAGYAGSGDSGMKPEIRHPLCVEEQSGLAKAKYF